MALFPTSRVICNKTDIRQRGTRRFKCQHWWFCKYDSDIIVLEVIMLAALVNSLNCKRNVRNLMQSVYISGKLKNKY